MKRTPVIIGIVGLIVVVAVTFPLWRPLFVNQTVDEAFPFENMSEDERTAFNAMPADQRTMLLDMNEENPEMAAANVRAMAEPDTEAADDMPEAVAAGPVILSQGTFNEIDVIHRGEGSATIYQLPEGGAVLRLEDFQVTNGPQLHVLLVRNPDPRTRADVGEDYIDLGQLKGNVGNQNYDIPADVDLEGYNSVVIYCMPFHVVFSVATQETVAASVDAEEVPVVNEAPAADEAAADAQSAAPVDLEEAAAIVEEEAAAPVNAAPVSLGSGTFQGAGRGYDGSGSFQFTSRDDGSLTLELGDDFTVTRGPELFVYLGQTSNPAEPSTFNDTGVNLGALRNNSGSQTYNIPADVNVDDYDHVIIYCAPFTVVFSYGEIER